MLREVRGGVERGGMVVGTAAARDLVEVADPCPAVLAAASPSE